MRVLIAFFLIIIFNGLSCSFKVIDLNTYKNYKNFLTQNKSKITNKADTFINYLCSSNCFYFLSGTYIYAKPSCFSNYCENSYNKQFLNFKEAVDKVWPFIKGFDKIYDLNSTSFYYFPAKPKFYYEYNLDNFIGTSKIDDLLLAVLESGNYYIKIPKIFLAFKQVKNYSFYVSDKNLAKRNKSRLHNFYLAMNKLDGYILNPQEELNFNKLIAYLPGYKKKNPNSNLMFYGGVCGVSTMLFRNALINPFLYVKERYNHSQWYVYFYSNYIWGDDAAVYEWIKKLIVKNISSWPIYFRKKQIQDKLYFVSIVPVKTNDFVLVNKKQTGKLKAYLESIVFNEFGQEKYKQSWISRYNMKNYER